MSDLRPRERITLDDTTTTEHEPAVQIFTERVPHKDPHVQALIDAIPPSFMRRNLTDKQIKTFRSGLDAAADMREAFFTVQQIVRARHTTAINKLLQRLDNSDYDRRWLCPDCDNRWGEHDENLKCPGDAPGEDGE